MSGLTHEQRIFGGLYGSLVGDALGVPVEFAPRSARKTDPVTGMRGYGTHHQPPGTWSDDGALLLCSVESLTETGFDTQDMGDRFLRWYDSGLWAAHGLVFDIGNATRIALNRIGAAIPAEEAGGRDPYSNGNGSLMRILPVTLASLNEDQSEFVDRLQRASSITHGHPRSQLACVFHGLLVRELMSGQPPLRAFECVQDTFAALYANHPEFGAFRDLLQPEFAATPESQIRSGGYVIDTLTASIWCLLSTNTFADGVLQAVNLGDDTDTTGCVAGGLAGIVYGMDAIPTEWLGVLPRPSDLQDLFGRFCISPNGTKQQSPGQATQERSPGFRGSNPRSCVEP